MKSFDSVAAKHVGFALLAFVGLVLLMRPTLHVLYLPMYFLFAATLAVYAFLLFMFSNTNTYRFETPRASLLLGISAVIVFTGALVATLGSSFLVEKRSSVSGLHLAQSASSLPSLDAKQVPLVSASVAHRAMSRRLGEDLGLGSQFEVGTPVKQVYQGRLTWVAPLEPRSAFKALFGDVSPAFMTVDASDPGQVQFVRKAVHISDRELIGLNTRLWFTNPSLHAFSWFFEVDEDANPYWVAPLTQKRAGVMGLDVHKVAILNAVSGELVVMALSEVPSWVDNIYPASLVEVQIDTTGNLVKGWFNPTDDGKFQVTGTPDQVLVDGQMWHLGTLSSISRAESVTEGVLVNSRTKEIRRFELQGVTEKVAATAMEAQNPEKRLQASNPAMYMVDGLPAYVSALSSEDDVIRGYGIVAVQDAQLVAVADTLDVALKQFAARRTRSTVALGLNVEETSLQETVQVIRQDVASGQYYLLMRPSGVLVVSAPHLSDELHVTEAGDLVRMKIRQTEGASSPVLEFKNLTKFPE